MDENCFWFKSCQKVFVFWTFFSCLCLNVVFGMNESWWLPIPNQKFCYLSYFFPPTFLLKQSTLPSKCWYTTSTLGGGGKCRVSMKVDYILVEGSGGKAAKMCYLGSDEAAWVFSMLRAFEPKTFSRRSRRICSSRCTEWTDVEKIIPGTNDADRILGCLKEKLWQ